MKRERLYVLEAEGDQTLAVSDSLLDTSCERSRIFGIGAHGRGATRLVERLVS